MTPEVSNSEPRSGLSYNKLHAPVRSYIDNLRAQVYEVLHKYGTANMTEFIAKTKHVKVEDRQRVIRLMESIATAYQTNKVEDSKEYTMDVSRYEQAFPSLINGNIYCHVTVHEPGQLARWAYIDQDGNRFGDGFDHVTHLKSLAGQLVYLADKNSQHMVAVGTEGKQIGGAYESIRAPREVNGRIMFAAYKADKWLIIDQDGKPIGGVYDQVGDPVSIDGKVAFAAKVGSRWFIKGPGGITFAGPFEFDDIGDPQIINDKLYFSARKFGYSFLADSQGNQVGQKFDTTGDPFGVEDRIIFSASNRDVSFLADHVGNHIGSPYETINEGVRLGDRVIFTGRRNNLWYVFDHHGDLISQEGYDSVGKPVLVGGQVVFKAEKDGHWLLVCENGAPIPLDFDSIYDVVPFDDDSCFVLTRKDKMVYKKLYKVS